MTVSKKHLGIIGLILLSHLTGCGRDPRRDVPGHLQPGPSIDVARQWLGSSGPNGEGMTIGVSPMVDWTSPNIPLMQDGVVDPVYFWPRSSNDGESLREGHYVYVKVAEQSFTEEHANSQRTLLNDAENIAPGSLERPRSTQLKDRASTDSLVQEPELPYSVNAPTQTRLSVVEVDPRSGQSQVLGTQTVPGSAAPNSGQAATQDSVLRMLDNFNAMNQRQIQQASPATPAPQSGTQQTPRPGLDK